jgi:hypothetical protein
VTCALHPRARHAGRVRAARVARAVEEVPRAPKKGRRGEEIGGDSTTVGRGRPPALIRLARRSQIRRATVAPATFSRLAREGTWRGVEIPNEAKYLRRMLEFEKIDSAPATRSSSQGDEPLKMKSATRPHSAVPSLARRERVDGVTCALHPRARHAGRGESRARCARGGGDATRSERGRRGEEIGGDSATVGRGRPPALIRLARRSQIRRATVAPATFSRQREKGQSGTQKQTHSRVRRMDGVTM